MGESVIVALLSLAGTLAGSYFAQRKSTALISYRIEQLEKKVEAHNHLKDRMADVESNQKVIEEKIRVANHRIDDLEGEVKNE